MHRNLLAFIHFSQGGLIGIVLLNKLLRSVDCGSCMNSGRRPTATVTASGYRSVTLCDGEVDTGPQSI